MWLPGAQEPKRTQKTTETTRIRVPKRDAAPGLGEIARLYFNLARSSFFSDDNLIAAPSLSKRAYPCVCWAHFEGDEIELLHSSCSMHLSTREAKGSSSNAGR